MEIIRATSTPPNSQQPHLQKAPTSEAATSAVKTQTRDAVQQAARVEAAKAEAAKENVDAKTIDKVNADVGKLTGYQMQFELTDDKSVVIKLLDKDNQEVIRQIPSEAVLRIRQHLQEISGLLLDKNA